MVSKRQREIYDFIVAYARKHGYPPTVREIGADVGLASPSTVHVHLAKLEQAGYVRRDPTKPRALELVGRDAPQGRDAGSVHVLAAHRRDRSGLAAPRRAEHRGLPRRARAARARRRRVPAARSRRQHDRGRNHARRLRRRPQAADGGDRGRCRGAARRRRDRGRGDGQDVLSRERPDPAPAGELGSSLYPGTCRSSERSASSGAYDDDLSTTSSPSERASEEMARPKLCCYPEVAVRPQGRSRPMLTPAPSIEAARGAALRRDRRMPRVRRGGRGAGERSASSAPPADRCSSRRRRRSRGSSPSSAAERAGKE